MPRVQDLQRLVVRRSGWLSALHRLVLTDLRGRTVLDTQVIGGRLAAFADGTEHLSLTPAGRPGTYALADGEGVVLAVIALHGVVSTLLGKNWSIFAPDGTTLLGRIQEGFLSNEVSRWLPLVPRKVDVVWRGRTVASVRERFPPLFGSAIVRFRPQAAGIDRTIVLGAVLAQAWVEDDAGTVADQQVVANVLDWVTAADQSSSSRTAASSR